MTLDGNEEGAEHLLALGGRGFQLVVDLAVFLRLCTAEENVLQLGLDAVESQLVGNGDVQEHGLGDFPFLGGLGQQLNVAHHVETVGYLDEHYPRVAGVGDDQALVVFGLKACLLGFDGGYLVEALCYVYDVRCKCILRQALQDFGIKADGFMEKHGNDALVTKVDVLGYNPGHSEGMLDEWMPVFPELVLHGFVCDVEGFEYLFLLTLGIAGENCVECVLLSVHFLSFISSYISSLYLAAAGKSRALAASSIFFLAASTASSSCLGLILDITGSSATYRILSSSSGSL